MSYFGLKEAKFTGIFAGAALAVLLPIFAFGDGDVIFVDKDASGSETGSFSHPYHTIGRALDHADSGTEVRVKKGTYKENIEIPKGVKVVSDGEDRSDVVIDGSDKKPTVTMKHKSTLSHVTVKEGRNGIRIDDDSKAHVFDVLVKGAERDGIHIESSPRDKKYRAYLDKVEVKDSGKTGIYAKKRLVVIVGSKIHDNASEGIDFQAGVDAWLEGNKVYDNKGTGWKVVMDGSEIWTTKNDFRRNGREGIQVESFGAPGKFGVKKSKAVDNGRYGIAVVARNDAALGMWKNIFLENNSVFGNVLGQVSKVILVR